MLRRTKKEERRGKTGTPTQWPGGGKEGGGAEGNEHGGPSYHGDKGDMDSHTHCR